MVGFKKAGILSAIAALLFTAALLWSDLSVFAAEDSNGSQHEEEIGNEFLYLKDSFYIETGFSSHLTLLVIRADGTTEFYSGDEKNRICEEQPPVIYGEAVKITEKNPALNREKADYQLTISAASQNAANILWNGAVSNEWLLLGNMYDKSLLRDYLALSLARELDDDVPFVQYCEVLLEDETGLLYQGVYLLAAPPESSSYYLERYEDTEPMDGTLLYTYAFNEGLLAGLHVEKGRTFTGMERITLEHSVSIVENVIYSKDYNHFAKYPSYIDEQSFFDFFIINELFGNYAKVSASATYIFDLPAVSLKLLTTPGFEFSLDNDPASAMELEEVKLLDGPYYSQLNQNTIFLKDLLNRYRFLCQDILKSSHLEIRIDETVSYLGDARKRDWARWQESYSGAKMFWLPNEGLEGSSDVFTAEIPLNRNTFTYEQEIIKLKFTLREHGRFMFPGISAYYKQDNMIGEDAYYVKNTYLLLGYFTLIFLSVRIVRRLRR